MEIIKDIPNYNGLYEITTSGIIYRKEESYINNLGNKCVPGIRDIPNYKNKDKVK